MKASNMHLSPPRARPQVPHVLIENVGFIKIPPIQMTKMIGYTHKFWDLGHTKLASRTSCWRSCGVLVKAFKIKPSQGLEKIMKKLVASKLLKHLEGQYEVIHLRTPFVLAWNMHIFQINNLKWMYRNNDPSSAFF